MSLTKRILSCMLLLLLLALVLLNAWHGEQEKRQEKQIFQQFSVKERKSRKHWQMQNRWKSLKIRK